MVSVSKEFVLQRQQSVLDCLEVHGTMSINDIARLIEANYYTTRNDINELIKQGKVRISRKEGKTHYYTLVGRSAIPSLLTRLGYAHYKTILKTMLDKGKLISWPTGYVEEALAYFYAQPIIAAVGGEIKHNEIEYMIKHIDEVIDMIDALRRQLVDLKTRVFTDSVAEFESWADDPYYDREVAINALFKFVDNEVVAHQPYLEALKRAEVSHISVDTGSLE